MTADTWSTGDLVAFGASYRQVFYWARRGYLGPIIRERHAREGGWPRYRYTAANVAAALVMVAMSDWADSLNGGLELAVRTAALVYPIVAADMAWERLVVVLGADSVAVVDEDAVGAEIVGPCTLVHVGVVLAPLVREQVAS